MSVLFGVILFFPTLCDAERKCSNDAAVVEVDKIDESVVFSVDEEAMFAAQQITQNNNFMYHTIMICFVHGF